MNGFRDAQMLTMLGILLIATAVVLSWALYPRAGKETRVMRVPGAWVFFPLLVILCLLGGSGLIYTYIGR